MRVSASSSRTDMPREVEALLPALLPQVDELVVVANRPGLGAGGAARRASACSRTAGRCRSRRTSTSGRRRRRGELVLNATPDAVPAARRRRRAARGARGATAGRHRRPADGLAGRHAGSRRGVASRRCAARSCAAPRSVTCAATYAQRQHYALDERPTEPVPCDWMLGAFLLMRRTMLDELGGWDAGYRHYVEDIDLQYRAMRAGWERWYVPDGASSRHAYAAVIDKRWLSRHTLWHARGMARFVRKHPSTLSGAVSKADQYARQAHGWSEASYADPRSYLDHRAELVVELGAPLAPGDDRARPRLRRRRARPAPPARAGLVYRGVDAEPAMVAAARGLLGETAAVEDGDLDTYTPSGARRRARRCSARSTTRAIGRRSSAGCAGSPTRKLVFDLDPRQFDVDDVRAELLRGRVRCARRCDPFLLPQTRSLPGPGDGGAAGGRAVGPARACAAARPVHVPRRRRGRARAASPGSA